MQQDFNERCVEIACKKRKGAKHCMRYDMDDLQMLSPVLVNGLRYNERMSETSDCRSSEMVSGAT